MSRSFTASATLLAAFSLAGAAHALPMGGTYTGRVESQKVRPLGGPDHVIIEQISTGQNTGPGTPLDGAKVQWEETVTLRNGQGPMRGVIIQTTPAGSTSSAYEGMVTTDPQGRITAKGRFKTSEATGEFAGLRGRGEFSAAYTSKSEFAGDWRGDFKMPGQKTSRR